MPPDNLKVKEGAKVLCTVKGSYSFWVDGDLSMAWSAFSHSMISHLKSGRKAFV